MSNRKRLPGSRAARPHCGTCGRSVPKGMYSKALADGRVVCDRCIGQNALFRRLPCGHMGIPGMTVIADSADLSNFKCARCSPHAARGMTGSTA